MKNSIFNCDKGPANQVFVKVDYSTAKSFGRNQRNRVVSKQHVNDFYQKICSNGVSQDGTGYGPYPIHVNIRTNHILDGQHRLAAYLKAIEEEKIPSDTLIYVAYEDLDEESEISKIIDLNINSKNWTLDDYVDCEKCCNDNFRRLTEFAETHSLCHTENSKGEKKCKYRYAAAILTGRGSAAALKNRTIQISDEDIERGELVHEELIGIRKVLAKLRGIEYNEGTYFDTEGMAIQWMDYRNRLTVDDFKNGYIPKNLLNIDARKQADWHNLFNEVFCKKYKNAA